MAPNPNRQLLIGLSLAAFTGFCWAILAIGLKYALHFTSTGTIVWIRMVFAFFLLLGYFLWKKPASIRKVFLKAPALGVWAGLLLAINYFTYMRGLELTAAANAQIMIQLGPLLFLFIGVLYFNEKLNAIQWFGIGVASSGFALFNWDQIVVAFANARGYLIGNLWILLGSITWAVFAGFQKILFTRGPRAKKNLNESPEKWTPQELNLLVYGICLLVLYPMADVSELPPLDLGQWFVLFLLGVNTLLAYGAFAEANQRAPASYVSLIIAANPLLTIFILKVMEHYGVDFISPEPISWRGYTGALCVVAGVAIAVSAKTRPQS